MKKAKKTVLFIVEGISDKEALEKIFKQIYKNNKEIEFTFAQGDISSDENTTEMNVEDKIYNIVLDFMKDKKLNKADICQIIQLFDMDGAYIPEENIVEGGTSQLVYSTSNISCKQKEKVIKRNNAKKKIINYLLEKNDIKGINYEMYFMSCNLDHALYDQINLDHSMKVQYADAFYERFLRKEKMFILFLKDEVVNGVPDTMAASWRYIREDVHSLERHTNLHIYFTRYPVVDGML